MAKCSKCGKKLWFGGYEWDNKDYCSKCYDSIFESKPYVPSSYTASSKSKTTQAKTTHTSTRTSSNYTTTTYNDSSSSVGYDYNYSTSNASSDSSLCAYYQNGCCKHGYNSAYNNISCDYSECFQNLCPNYQRR